MAPRRVTATSLRDTLRVQHGQGLVQVPSQLGVRAVYRLRQNLILHLEAQLTPHALQPTLTQRELSRVNKTRTKHACGTTEIGFAQCLATLDHVAGPPTRDPQPAGDLARGAHPCLVLAHEDFGRRPARPTDLLTAAGQTTAQSRRHQRLRPPGPGRQTGAGSHQLTQGVRLQTSQRLNQPQGLTSSQPRPLTLREILISARAHAVSRPPRPGSDKPLNQSCQRGSRRHRSEVLSSLGLRISMSASTGLSASLIASVPSTRHGPHLIPVRPTLGCEPRLRAPRLEHMYSLPVLATEDKVIKDLRSRQTLTHAHHSSEIPHHATKRPHRMRRLPTG